MRSSAAELLSGPFLRQRLGQGFTSELRIRGNSMAPLLTNGSVVRLRPLVSHEALKGSFVAVELDSRVVVHRVDAEEPELVHTRGLRSQKSDPPTPRAEVIGVVSKQLAPVAVPESALRLAGNLVSPVIRGLRRILRR